MKNRIAKWDNLKGLLIISVVIGHFVEPLVEYSWAYKVIWTAIYFVHMPLMIFLAGMFIKNIVKDKERSKNKILYYVRIYVTYKILLLITKMIITGEGGFSLLKEDGIPWFMLAMAWFIGITYLIKDVKPTYAIVGSLILSCAIGYDGGINDYLVLARTINFYPFFLMGYHTKFDTDILKATKNKKIISLGILTCFMAFVCLFTEKAYRFRPLLTGRNTYYKFYNYERGWFYRLVCFIIVCLVGYALINLTTSKPTPITNIGKRTLQVYIVHGIFARAFRYMELEDWIRINLPNRWKLIILVIAFIVAGISAINYRELYNKAYNKIKKVNS